MQKLVKIKITEELFHELCSQGILTPDCIIEVITDDSFLQDDETYSSLKKQSLKAYKQLKEYAFKKLHNIKD